MGIGLISDFENRDLGVKWPQYPLMRIPENSEILAMINRLNTPPDKALNGFVIDWMTLPQATLPHTHPNQVQTLSGYIRRSIVHLYVVRTCSAYNGHYVKFDISNVLEWEIPGLIVVICGDKWGKWTGEYSFGKNFAGGVGILWVFNTVNISWQYYMNLYLMP